MAKTWSTLCIFILRSLPVLFVQFCLLLWRKKPEEVRKEGVRFHRWFHCGKKTWWGIYLTLGSDRRQGHGHVNVDSLFVFHRDAPYYQDGLIISINTRFPDPRMDPRIIWKTLNMVVKWNSRANTVLLKGIRNRTCNNQGNMA